MWTLARVRQAWPQEGRPWLSRHAWFFGVLAAFSVLTAVLPDRLPAHSHSSFVARSDCARSLVCEVVLGSWSPPSFHLMGPLLRLVPSSVEGRACLDFALTLLTFTLAYAAMGQLFRQFLGYTERRSRRVATWGVLLAAVHPALLRLTTAGDFWPYTGALLWGAILATLLARQGLLAAEGGSDVARFPPRGVVFDLGAACLLLALASLGNIVTFLLAPLPLIVALCWFRPWRYGPRRRHLWDWRWWRARSPWWPLAGVMAFFLAWVGRAALRVLNSGMVHFDALPASDQGFVGSWWLVVTNHLLLNPAYSSPVLAGLFVVGLGTMMRDARPRRAVLPLLYATFALEWALSNDVSGLDVGYPTRFHNGHITFFLATPWLAVGTHRAMTWLPGVWSRWRGTAPRRPHRWAAMVLVVVWLLSSAVTGHESWRFLLESQILGVEVGEIGRISHLLPPHDVLVIPPLSYAPPAGLRWAQDPIEAQFPKGDYRAAMIAAGRRPARIVSLQDFLHLDVLHSNGPPQARQRVLCYLGSTLKTFGVTEIRAARVPADLQRVELRELLKRFRLEPVQTFQLATAQHPLATMRLGADRVAHVTVGFYWLRPR